MSEDQYPEQTSTGDETAESPSRIVHAAYASFQGPLPPAEQFQQYEQVLAGAGERILAMAEQEQRHRQDQQRSDLRAEAHDLQAQRRQIKRGQTYGLIVSLTAIVAGAGTATVGALAQSISGTVIGGILGGGGLASVIYAFTTAGPIQSPAENEREQEH